MYELTQFGDPANNNDNYYTLKSPTEVTGAGSITFTEINTLNTTYNFNEVFAYTGTTLVSNSTFPGQQLRYFGRLGIGNGYTNKLLFVDDSIAPERFFLVTNSSQVVNQFPQAADPSGATPTYYPGFIGYTNNTITTLNPVCFLEGTKIKCISIDVPIENLKIGDLIQTSQGPRAIKFIAKTTLPMRDLTACGKQPIMLESHALGSLGPDAPLWLSPSHAIDFAGCLVEAGALINGTSIHRVDSQQLQQAGFDPEVVTYYNIELEIHAVIYANGLAVESYYANPRSHGLSRRDWDNYDDYLALYGESVPMQELPFPRIPFARQIPPAVREMIPEEPQLVG